jgi:hypothetical protein
MEQVTESITHIQGFPERDVPDLTDTIRAMANPFSEASILARKFKAGFNARMNAQPGKAKRAYWNRKMKSRICKDFFGEHQTGSHKSSIKARYFIYKRRAYKLK